MFIISLLCILIAAAAVLVYLSGMFGKTPSAVEAARYESLPYYQNGAFKSTEEIVYHFDKVQGGSLSPFKFFKKSEYAPKHRLPKVMLDKASFAGTPSDFSLIWLGHSSAILELGSKRLIIDPVLENGGPLPFIVQRYDESPLSPGTLSEVDYILLTHNHYDHMEKKTLTAFKKGHFIVPLGVGAALKGWGIDPSRITELKWDETYRADGLTITGVEGRHYSGRSFWDKNKTLWNSYVVSGSGRNVFWGGDTGYGQHFKRIGAQYGPFDFAALEIDAWNPGWPDIHLFPSQVIRAAKDLNAPRVLPIHWGVFDLAMHPWHESVDAVIAESDGSGIDVMTPVMGEKIVPGQTKTEHWWKLLARD